MEFWGDEVKAGKPLKVKPDVDGLVHLTQAALGEKGEYGVLYWTVDGKKTPFGRLSDKIPQLTFHLVFAKEFELSHSMERGSVHFCGHKSPNHYPFSFLDDHLAPRVSTEEDYPSVSEEVEDVEVPATVTANGNSGAAAEE